MLSLFAGTDDFRRRNARDQYLGNLLPREEWQNEVTRLEGDKMSLENLKGALDHVSLFGGGVKVIVERAEKMDKAEELLALKVAKDPEIELMLDYSSGTPSKSLLDKGKIFWAKPMKPAEAASWLVKEWNGQTSTERRISSEIAQYLVFRTGQSESGPLWQELTKVAAWNAGQAITLDAIEKVSTAGGVKTPWRFYDLVAERKTAEALDELEGLSLNPDFPGVRIVIGLTNHLLGVAHCRSALTSGLETRELGWMADKWTRQARLWTETEISQAVRSLLKCDLAIKSGTSDVRALRIVIMESIKGSKA